MQVTDEDFDLLFHKKFKALIVKEPWGDKIINGDKSIEIRSKDTNYRGSVLICNGVFGQLSVPAGVVKLYQTKPIEELTNEEFYLTGVPIEKRDKQKGFAWFLKSPKKAQGIAIKGCSGLFDLYVENGDIQVFDENGEPDVQGANGYMILIVYVFSFVIGGAFLWGLWKLVFERIFNLMLS